MKHIPFPDIGQFKNAIRAVKEKATYIGKDANGDVIYDPTVRLPVLTYSGTVKLHGTNAAIGRAPDGTIWFQSRERVISKMNDNMGFCAKYEGLPEVASLFNSYGLIKSDTHNVVIYGEWVGNGIQKGVAVSQLSKRFVVFAARVGDEWLSKEVVSRIKDHSVDIYNINDYPSWEISIDFNSPELSQNKLIELTEVVEQNCPFSNVHGISGIGEGIVWVPVDPEWREGKFWMKVKGEKHSVSKVKTLAPIDVEAVKSINEFISKVVTPARCEQSVSKLRESGKPLDRTSLGDFIRWIFNDVIKEDSDTAKASGIDLDKIGGPISKAAKDWFFKNEDSF
jgi:hypothetical protein